MIFNRFSKPHILPMAPPADAADPTPVGGCHRKHSFLFGLKGPKLPSKRRSPPMAGFLLDQAKDRTIAEKLAISLKLASADPARKPLISRRMIQWLSGRTDILPRTTTRRTEGHFARVIVGKAAIEIASFERSHRPDVLIRDQMSRRSMRFPRQSTRCCPRNLLGSTAQSAHPPFF